MPCGLTEAVFFFQNNVVCFAASWHDIGTYAYKPQAQATEKGHRKKGTRMLAMGKAGQGKAGQDSWAFPFLAFLLPIISMARVASLIKYLFKCMRVFKS